MTSTNLTSRLAALTKLRCSIFQTSYNPTSVRTGAKYLRARLRGPSMVNYYPIKLSVADFNHFARGELKLRDPKEEDRLRDVEERRKRGKGAPKKAKSKGRFCVQRTLYMIITTLFTLSRQSESKQKAVKYGQELMGMLYHGRRKHACHTLESRLSLFTFQQFYLDIDWDTQNSCLCFNILQDTGKSMSNTQREADPVWCLRLPFTEPYTIREDLELAQQAVKALAAPLRQSMTHVQTVRILMRQFNLRHRCKGVSVIYYCRASLTGMTLRCKGASCEVARSFLLAIR